MDTASTAASPKSPTPQVEQWYHKPNWLRWILIIILVALLSSLATYAVTISMVKQQQTRTTTACTEETRICPDGTNVGRVPPSCEFTPCPTPKESTPSAKTAPNNQPSLKSIPILSTADWQSVSFNGITFQIPPESRFADEGYPDDPNDGFIFWDSQSIIPQRILVEPYTGGSRREQFLKKYSINVCNPIFVEALFGKVTALQIAIDGGACQGGGGGIVAVVGNKYVEFIALHYTSAGEIFRFNKRDTVVSTLQP